MEIPKPENKYGMTRPENDPETILRMKGFEFPNLSFIHEIGSEKDKNGVAYFGKVFWIEFEEDGVKKSGKLFVPENQSGKLVAFYGGLPGENIVAMERLHANKLLENGYTVWSSRHGGTKIQEGNIEYYLGSQETFQILQTTGRTSVGKELRPEYLRDFVEEPETDLAVFNGQDQIKDITLIGHSFGATSILHSMRNSTKKSETGKANFSKVKKVLLINGLYGNGTFPDKEDEIIDGTRITRKQFEGLALGKTRDFIDVPQSANSVGYVKDILADIDGTTFPDNTEIVIVAAPTDAYLTPEAAEKVFSAQKNGLLVYDLTQGDIQPPQLNANKMFGPEFGEATPEVIKAANEESKKTFGGSQHSSSNLQASTLLRLIELDVQNKHRVCLREQKSRV